MTTATPPHPDLLLTPAHLAGPGHSDIPFVLAAEYGWYRPLDAPAHVILISAQESLTLSRSSQSWVLTGSSGWRAEFSDRTPAELVLAVATTASDTERTHAPSPPLNGHAASARLLAAGWASTHRDGYRLVSAPDRLAALSVPDSAPDPHVALTGAAGTSTWTARFTRGAPDHLLTAAATALLQPLSRLPWQVSQQALPLILTPHQEAGPAASASSRSAAARAAGIAAHPALRYLPPLIAPPEPRRLPLPASVNRSHRSVR